MDCREGGDPQTRGGILRVWCQRELSSLNVCGHLEVHRIPWQDPLGQSELSISDLDNMKPSGTTWIAARPGPLAKEAHIARPSRHEPPLRSVPMAVFDRLCGFQ